MLQQEINQIMSLQKDIRNPKLSTKILQSIDTIQKCVKNGMDQQGWKKVDWRNSNYAPKKNTSQSSHTYHPPRNSYRGKLEDESIKPNEHIRTIPSEHIRTIPSEHIRTIPPKYVSKFNKVSENVDDAILNRILLGKLNKFNKSNYNDIKEFITNIIDDGQTVMITSFMKSVFEKAASEEIFCPLYAKLLSELSSSYPIILTEMNNLYKEYINIFQEIKDGYQEDYDELCKRNIIKKYRRGYSQFLTELIKYQIIDTNTFMKTIETIITQIEQSYTEVSSIKLIEEYADCLMKIIKAMKPNQILLDDDKEEDFEKMEQAMKPIRKILKEYLSKHIQPFTVRNPLYTGISTKTRYTFLDIYEAL